MSVAGRVGPGLAALRAAAAELPSPGSRAVLNERQPRRAEGNCPFLGAHSEPAGSGLGAPHNTMGAHELQIPSHVPPLDSTSSVPCQGLVGSCGQHPRGPHHQRLAAVYLLRPRPGAGPSECAAVPAGQGAPAATLFPSVIRKKAPPPRTLRPIPQRKLQ